MTLLVDDVTPVIRLVAAAGQTIFDFPFLVLASGDLAVTVNDVERTDFTVDGLGEQAGGSITFTSGLTLDDDVVIARQMPLERQSDYPPAGDFNPDALDLDLIRLLLMVQQQNREAVRSIKVPIDETVDDLPDAAERANKSLVFDADGQPTVAATPADVQQSVDAAALSALTATAEAAAALTSEEQAALSAILAVNASAAALQAQGVFETVAKAMSKGVLGTTALVAGAGGTNGTFDLGFAGGGGGVGAAGRFTVVGGALSSVTITAPGSGYTAAPDLSFAASAGLAGAAATAVFGNNVDAGEYFSVPASDDFEQFILYQNIAGVATEVKRYAGLTVTDTQRFPQPVVASREGMGITQGRRGGLTVPLSPDTLLSLTERLLSGMSFGFGVARGLLFDINHILLTGQSNGGFYITPGDVYYPWMDPYVLLQTTYQRYGNLRPTVGLYLGDLITDDFTLIPLTPDAGKTHGTIPAWGMADYAKRLLQIANGYDGRFVVSGCNQGGAALDNIMPGGAAQNTTFWKGCRQIQGIKAAAAAQYPGKTFGLPFVPLIHGESASAGGTRADYVAKLGLYYQYVNGQLAVVPPANTPASFKAASGQASDIPLFISQIQQGGGSAASAYNVKRAQYEAARDNAGIRLVCPTYWLNYWDPQHYNAHGSHLLGQMFARAYAFEAATGQKWVPLQPIESTIVHVSGTSISFRVQRPFNAPILFDTVTIPDRGGYGFQVMSAGLAELAITSVTISEGDKITINYAGGAGAALRYALRDFDTNGALGSASGNLRTDTLAGALSTVRDHIGQIPEMHDWCVAFEVALP